MDCGAGGIGIGVLWREGQQAPVISQGPFPGALLRQKAGARPVGFQVAGIEGYRLRKVLVAVRQVVLRGVGLAARDMGVGIIRVEGDSLAQILDGRARLAGLAAATPRQ